MCYIELLGGMYRESHDFNAHSMRDPLKLCVIYLHVIIPVFHLQATTAMHEIMRLTQECSL